MMGGFLEQCGEEKGKMVGVIVGRHYLKVRVYIRKSPHKKVVRLKILFHFID